VLFWPLSGQKAPAGARNSARRGGALPNCGDRAAFPWSRDGRDSTRVRAGKIWRRGAPSHPQMGLPHTHNGAPNNLLPLREIKDSHISDGALSRPSPLAGLSACARRGARPRSGWEDEGTRRQARSVFLPWGSSLAAPAIEVRLPPPPLILPSFAWAPRRAHALNPARGEGKRLTPRRVNAVGLRAEGRARGPSA